MSTTHFFFNVKNIHAHKNYTELGINVPVDISYNDSKEFAKQTQPQPHNAMKTPYTYYTHAHRCMARLS